jgi:hypothetical protein
MKCPQFEYFGWEEENSVPMKNSRYVSPFCKIKTEKNIEAVKFKTFIFNRKDLNEVLETVHTPLIALDVPGFTQRECEILILYADDIPLLASERGEEFRLEVAVTEVYYDDGSIWEAKNLPGKLDPSKMR